ncbi:hypothetical protein [Marinobacter similis]|uniref:Uncharacterized protein n=1 Tax=Marinobacter similis TaxID=1420916 RepID=W5YLY9_9GAMM|nr:hypothetical protein [Marinobacter similis]AHI30060.1 hypothetical protein AU14_07650 [Marinobacter similis]
MKKMLTISGLLAGVLLLGGCADGSSNGLERPDPSVDFTTFVKAEIANTSDTRAAVEINDTDFSFNDENNPQAYDDLFR